MSIARSEVEVFFARYQALFNAAVDGAANMDAIAGLYTSEFIASGPHGVRTGTLGDEFMAAMAQGYERYRDLGTTGMEVMGIDIHPIDDIHVLVRVQWQATYQQSERAEVQIPFDVSYLLVQTDDGLKVFGWIAGDEAALLKAHGIG